MQVNTAKRLLRRSQGGLKLPNAVLSTEVAKSWEWVGIVRVHARGENLQALNILAS